MFSSSFAFNLKLRQYIALHLYRYWLPDESEKNDIKRLAAAGPTTHYLPRHIMPFDPLNEGGNRVG